MSDVATKPRAEVRPKTQRPRLHKVILLNDDYTPREFVVAVLKAEFRMSEEQAYRVMITAHRRGLCVVAVFAKDVAETKAARATEAARSRGVGRPFAATPIHPSKPGSDSMFGPDKAITWMSRPMPVRSSLVRRSSAASIVLA